jgi:hypothetical protein
MTTLCSTLTNLILIAQFIYIFAIYHKLPAIIPNDFDASGIPHKHAARAIVWVIFLGGLAINALLKAIAKHPNTFNLPSQPSDPDRPRQTAIAVELLGWMQLEIAILFAAILWSIANEAPHHEPILWIVPSIAAAILLTVFASIWRMMRPPTT